MSLIQNNDLADRLEKISTKAVTTNLVPMVTKNGILVGSYIIKPRDSVFDIILGSRVLYTTFSKSAAMIIAKMLIKNTKANLREILEADRIAFSARNDLELYKHHYENAERRNDFTKKDIFLSRFEVTNEKYQQAKQILHKSYSLLF